MVLFGLLFVKLNWVQVVQGRRVPHRRRPQPDPGAAAGVRAPARQHHRGRRGGRAERGDQGHAQVPAQLPGQGPLRARRRLPAGQPGRRPTSSGWRTSSSTAPPTCSPPTGCWRCSPARSRTGGNVLLTLRKQVQETAYKALLNNKTVEQDRRGGRDRPDRPAPSWPWCRPRATTRTRWCSHDFDAAKAAYDKLDKDPTKPLLNRALSETFPPGSTFKVIVVGGGAAERRSPRTRCSPAATATPRRTPRTPIRNSPGVVCPEPDHAAGRAEGLLQHRLRPARRRAARRGQAQGGRPQAFGFESDADVRPRRATTCMQVAASHTGDMQSPGRLDRPAGAGPVLHRAARGADDPAAGRAGRRGDRQRRQPDAARTWSTRCRTPTSRRSTAPTRRCCARRSPGGRGAAAADDGQRGRATAPARTRRSTASRSAARPGRRRMVTRPTTAGSSGSRARTASPSSRSRCCCRTPGPAAAARRRAIAGQVMKAAIAAKGLK